MPTATVKPKPGLFPEGAAVSAFLKSSCEVERRENRVPMVAPVDESVIANGAVSITAAAGTYVLFGNVDEYVELLVKAKKGKYKLAWEGQETAAIKFNATAAEVKTALVNLSNIGTEDVVVTGGPGDEAGATPYFIKFRKALSGKNVGAITSIVTELEESPKTVTLKVIENGSPGTAGQTVTCLFTIDAE